MFRYPSSSEYSEAVQHPRTAFTDPELRCGKIVANTLGLPIVLGGGFALTYTVEAPGRKFAVRCFHKKTDNLEERYQKISKALSGLSGGPFVEFKFQPQGVLVGGNRFPVVKMQWVEGPTLGVHLEAVYRDRVAVDKLGGELDHLQRFLTDQGIAHGDIQNGNMIVTRQGITLIDYDGMYVPGMAEGCGTELGHKHWQHPHRSHSDFGPMIDRFSFIMLKVSLAALRSRKDLFEKYYNGENLLFNANDYADPASSQLFRELRGIPEIARDAATFAELCAVPLGDVPDLKDFGRLINRRTPPLDADSAKRVPQIKGDAPYIAALPVVPANDYSFAQRHVGDRVELIGLIVEVYLGHDKNSDRFLFLNFAVHHHNRTYVKAIIWPSGLRACAIPPDESWQGCWVSVTGLVDPPYDGYSTTTISVTISTPSQLHRIDEREARYRLGLAFPTEIETEEDGRSNSQALANILRHVGKGSLPTTPKPKPVSPRPQWGKSDYSGKIAPRNQLLPSEKPPGRLGLLAEFARCEVTGRRLLLDELARSAVSNRLVGRDLLHPSARSGKLALAYEMVTCEKSGIEVLPAEAGRCSITGKLVDANLLGTSELSGRRALLRLMRRCALTQNLVLLEELEQCQLTGKAVIPSELETCAVTGVRALRQRMLSCEHTGKWILPAEAGRSAYSGKTVIRRLLLQSENPPGRLGLQDEFAQCAVTRRRLLLDELGRSVISNELVDRDLLHPSANSGKLALAVEMATCEESGIKLLPTEVARCSVTGKMVDARLLATSELSGRVAAARLMQRCASTGKLVLSQELERCELTWKWVLPGELATCVVTGMRALRGEMLEIGVLGKYLLPRETIEVELLRAFDRGEPYPDTYRAINWAGIPHEKFEREAMGRISRSRGRSHLSLLLEKAICPWLRCLLLRSEGRSWDAAKEAARLMATDPDEGRRIIHALASDLESLGREGCRLPLEAARMRSQLLGAEWPRDYPLPELREARAGLPAALRSRLREKLLEFLVK